MAKTKRKIVQVPGMHWTQVPENKAKMRASLRKALEKRHGKKHIKFAGEKSPAKKHAADKIEHERKLRRIRDNAYRARKAKEAQREMNRTLQALNQEMINNGQYEEIREKENISRVEEVARICYAKCDTWISTYADFNGVSESAVARWVGRALVAKASR